MYRIGKILVSAVLAWLGGYYVFYLLVEGSWVQPLLIVCLARQCQLYRGDHSSLHSANRYISNSYAMGT
jgi:hypothetical protein